MLFNSYAFIFIFLPITMVGYWLLVRWWPDTCVVWLSAASLAFYAGWNPRYIPLLMASVVGNYAFSKLIRRARRTSGRRAFGILTCAIVSNLALLGYFKYANFFVEVVQEATGLNYSVGAIILPLGISFFTFTQIAFLVDLSRGETSNLSFPKYFLFVTFFPHLIAGPILHHASIIPQFSWPRDQRKRDLEVGIAIFIFGLFKKVIIADSLTKFVTPVFDIAAQGHGLGLVESWAGVVAFSLQLYFDFSGYSDMAIGLARMCGVRFPLNCASPYKAHNIIGFWRRWHMTLSQFLRDYLYIPLGGNRRGSARRYINLIVTMVLGGLWHGASWTFVLWGTLHGIYLVLNHAWQFCRAQFGLRRCSTRSRTPDRYLCYFFGGNDRLGLLPRIFVTACDCGFARNGWNQWHTASIPMGIQIRAVRCSSQFVGDFCRHGGDFRRPASADADSFVFGAGVVFAEHTRDHDQLRAGFEYEQQGPGTAGWQWRPTPVWAFVMAILTLVPLLWLNQASEFLYYQF